MDPLTLAKKVGKVKNFKFLSSPRGEEVAPSVASFV
jgi:hypothetical protein